MTAVQLQRDPEKTRRLVGTILYVIGMLLGGLLLLGMFVMPAVFGRNADVEVSSMLIGALFALPMLVVYLGIPWFVDRYDPEPLWALGMALAWGGIAACGFSAVVNTAVHVMGDAMFGRGVGDVLGACVSAPLVEEATKAMAIAFMFFFWRRDFDGVVDGVIYATFAALGFAAIENIIYYGNAAKAEMLGREGVFAGTFIVRGILAPWGHPLYTSMTGLGFGIARETNKTWLKWMAPIGGYFAAAFLHSVWNTAATLSNALVMLMLPLWFLFVLGFMILVLWLVGRKGRIIRDHLKDEVLIGNMTQWELTLVTSPIARMRATFSYGGAAGRKFVDAAARLALSKWHTGRASQGRKLTVSADMIFPLRQELHKLRAEVSRALGRQVEQPRPWSPGGGPYHVPAPPHGVYGGQPPQHGGGHGPWGPR